ncbi:hypothetical protein CAP31_04035 [Sulfuriferula sp. AH1]|uniref:YqjK family protein n=1 Tax=Sulfuriferula sp. AH1 TaxID=1985873 RepID=UPI000B3B6A33|nr:YqjK family protein [Sulfuriferula sp. AH1]ARU30929.1 hypothetical protein CAP31_04035 [Sulfuriferula sp. AH1]
MKHCLTDVIDRRRTLLAKIDEQRTEVAALSRQWHKPLLAAESGLKAIRYLRAHPGMVIGSVAVLVLWRRKGLLRFARICWRNYPVLLSFGLKILPFIRPATGKARKPRS